MEARRRAAAVYTVALAGGLLLLCAAGSEHDSHTIAQPPSWPAAGREHERWPARAGLPGPPVPDPAKPEPNWSWDTVPIAFHGANQSGVFNAAAIATLAKHYLMVTVEKWYTACGSKHPIQNGPWCNVEKAMYSTFNAIKAINPNVTTIMYLNFMFDFSMYHLAGLVAAREATGEQLLLRDERGELVVLCNDANYYCNVTNFDWSKPAMIELWLDAVKNATSVGGVDGIFADHAGKGINSGRGHGPTPQFCNGKGKGHSCWNFTAGFAAQFNAGHEWMINTTQDMVARSGGPVVDGPYATWGRYGCDFQPTSRFGLHAAVQKGQSGEWGRPLRDRGQVRQPRGLQPRRQRPGRVPDVGREVHLPDVLRRRAKV